MAHSRNAIVGLALALGLTAGAASAGVITSGVFPGAGDSFYSAGDGGAGILQPGGQTAYLWTTGDFVSSTNASVAGSYQATSVTDTFQIQNYLGGGNNLTVDFLLNGVDVGSWTAFDDGYSGDIQTINFSASFAPVLVSGPFTAEYVIENTVPGGGGSIAFLDGGQGALYSAVPEPAVWALMLAGFGGLGASLRSRRKTSGAAVA